MELLLGKALKRGVIVSVITELTELKEINSENIHNYLFRILFYKKEDFYLFLQKRSQL